MVSIRAIYAMVLATLAAACAGGPGLSDTGLCTELTRYAEAVSGDEVSFVRLGRQGLWLIDHSKTCAHGDDQAAANFCKWLMEETSTEFMEATINLVMACLQGQRTQGYIGNTGIDTWEGKVRFYSPRIDAEDVEIEVSWKLVPVAEPWNDYLKIAVSHTREAPEIHSW